MRVISLTQSDFKGPNGIESSVSAVLAGDDERKSLVISSDNASYEKLLRVVESYKEGKVSNEDLATALLKASDLIGQVEEKLVNVAGVLDGRMNILGNRVTIDHEPLDEVLEGHILRLLKSDGTPTETKEWEMFARFIENLYANTSEFVRKQLFGWLDYENKTGRGFTLTPDGCFIAYKGCMGTVEEPLSIYTGTAFTNGVKFNGHIPNDLGAVVEMPRSEINDDPGTGCAPGLHAGTYDYAKGWSQGVLVTVKVNPRDVVAVPTECTAQKMRTCRYTVIESVEGPYTATSYFDEEDVDSVDFTDALINSLKGKTVTFKYQKKNGSEKTYTVKGVGFLNDLLSGTDNGQIKTFKLSRIVEVEDTAHSKKNTVDPEVLKVLSTLSFGDNFTLLYVNTRNVEKEHLAKFQSMTDNLVHAKTSDGHRSFRTDRIKEAAKVESSGTSNGSQSPEDLLTGVLTALFDDGFEFLSDTLKDVKNSIPEDAKDSLDKLSKGFPIDAESVEKFFKKFK